MQLVKRITEVSENARERMEALAELDIVSQDVLIEGVRKLEEQLWMIRS